ncbi:MAG: serine/threonine-protein kinase [bacterium]
MSNPEPLGQLGEFDLLHPIAQGGMGRVWRAIHRPSGTLSAVKTLAVGDDAEQDIFRREVRAVAQLSHPNIVALYGFGVSMTPTAGLDANTPWLAMELALGGSLVGHSGITSFARLRDLCADVLRALAHSHARGIVHRDIKPGNILIFPSSQGTTYKLTDFGIAHARGESKTTREVFASSAGTPWYMAPEQIESRWRDYGPWTDLYALGCLVWELTTGSTPFTGTQALMVARAHLQDDLPGFHPQIDLPPGFEKWVRRLLEKPLRYRYQRAADALHELLQLQTNGESEPPTFEFVAPEAFETFDILQTEPTVRSTTQLEGTSPKHFLPDAATKEFSIGPPIPADWREPAPAKHGGLGVGLELLGYREVPFVGRETERDALWNTLRRCAQRQTPHIVLVRGPSGGGKTSLLQWFERRAHETGAASVAWMQHGTDDSTENGLSGTLQRYLGCSGLNEERARERLQMALDGLVPPQEVPYESAVLSALMFGSKVTRFSSPIERFNGLLRLVKTHASTRPFVLLIDDAHRGYESLQLTQALVESRESAALLLVVAVNDEDFDVDEHVRAQIDALAYDESVCDIALKRLTDPEQNALVSELVNIDPKLQAKLIAASKGEPVYTIELLKTWLNSGSLSNVDGRLTLTQDFDFPADVPSILAGRFAADPGLRRALCAAALIGIVVPTEIWRPFSDLMGYASPLHRTDAIEPHPQGFRFASSLIRDAFVTIAQADPSVSNTHRALADIYASRPESSARQREAHHRLLSHDPAGA